MPYSHKQFSPGVNEELLASAEEILAIAQAVGLTEKPEVLKERLFNAVNDGDLTVAAACLEANAGTAVQLPIDVVDEDGNTCLSEAACYGETELVKFFLSKGAHPDTQNELGRTPLWRACYNGHHDVMKLLLQSGADKFIASNMGEEPGKQPGGTIKLFESVVSGTDMNHVRKKLSIREEFLISQLSS